MKTTLFALALSLSAALSPAHAAGCGTPGTAQVFKWKEGAGFVLQVYLDDLDVQLSWPGQQIGRVDRGDPGSRVFRIDGIVYQVTTTPVQALLAGGARPDDVALLALHSEHEVAALAANPAHPLTQFEDLGLRDRVPDGPTPALKFKLWRLAKPDGGELSQYFLSTVVGDQVVTVSALVVESTQKAQFLAAMDGYASQLRVMTPGDCPADATPEAL